MGLTGTVHDTPEDLKLRYRGSRAGELIKARLLEKQWRFKPTIPSCVMGNVNSLANKTVELAALVKNVKLYRECSLLWFTLTRLTINIPDANVELPSFTTLQADRDPKLSGKRKGGGLVLFINNRLCNPRHMTVKEITCCPDIKLLAVRLKPCYLPRVLALHSRLC